MFPLRLQHNQNISSISLHLNIPKQNISDKLCQNKESILIIEKRQIETSTQTTMFNIGVQEFYITTSPVNT